MVVDLKKPEYPPEMTGPEMKRIRAKLGLSAVELGRAFGYTGSDPSVRTVVHRYESDGREIPAWIARLVRMYESHGLPPEWLEPRKPIGETE